MSTLDLIASNIRYGKGGKSRKWEIPLVAVDSFLSASFVIHPYLLGVLLGDGSTKFRSVSWCKPDEFIAGKIAGLLPAGCSLSKKVSPGKSDAWSIVTNPRNGINPVMRELERLGIQGKGSHEKSIPSEYLFSSKEDRLHLLQGLMDTDGFAGESSEFCSTSIDLANGVAFLARSLGGRASIAEKPFPQYEHKGEKRTGRKAWRVVVSLPSEICPFSLPRKVETCNRPSRGLGRWIDSITKIDDGESVCITVDSSDSCFVADNFVVTHNTFQQLEFANQVVKHTGGKVLLLCPLAVQWQTKEEAEKFGIGCPVNIAETQMSVLDDPGITITNYEKLHHFDASKFIGVVLDESSCLKAFTSKTKQALCSTFYHTPYRLACTATPAPNDRMELGNHSEFLGIMPSSEMLSRWFINDGGKAGKYRLRKHGERDFWRWMASWSVCISSPSDLGFDGRDYMLPDLRTHEHVIESAARPGYLFAVPQKVSATEVHQEKRGALDERTQVVADLVNSDRDPWVVWVDTDYEADAVKKRIPDAVEVRGSHADYLKAQRLRGFAHGEFRVLITKAEIAGFGLNYQHCHKTTWFAGYSYERFYQAIRRLWRFGQTNPVDVHLIRTINEGSIVETIQRKQREHIEMQREMAALMADGMREEMGIISAPVKYEATRKMNLPAWLKSKEVTGNEVPC